MHEEKSSRYDLASLLCLIWFSTVVLLHHRGVCCVVLHVHNFHVTISGRTLPRGATEHVCPTDQRDCSMDGRSRHTQQGSQSGPIA
jgi:hypothetical protein